MKIKAVLGMLCGLVLVLVFFVHYFQSSSPQVPQSKKESVERAYRLPLDAHMSNSYTNDLPGLLKKGYIRVLTTLNRTNFFVSDGHLVGFEYSLLKGYENFLNSNIHKRNLQVVLEFIPVARDELIPKLKNGYGDIAAAGLTITSQRQKLVGALPICKYSTCLFLCHEFGKNLIKGFINQGTSKGKHLVAIGFEPPSTASFKTSMANELVG